MKENAARRNRT